MKIHTRLQVSNFLMILVPVGITLATGVLCLALVWLAMSVGGGLGFDDQEDFDEAGERIVQVTAQALAADDDATRLSRLDRLSALLDDNAMRLVVTFSHCALWQRAGFFNGFSGDGAGDRGGYSDRCDPDRADPDEPFSDALCFSQD